MLFDIKKETLEAEKRIRTHIRETPLEYSIPLSKLTGCNVYLKCENLQYTHSFKIRGALNKLLTLSPEQRKKGVVTASSGNHGTAVAYGLYKLGIPGIVFVPENASSAKVDNIRSYDIPLQFHGTCCMKAELHALEYAKQHDMLYISPYNDPQVIGGQGTIGLELSHQLDSIDAVFVAIGGGGLISGIAGYMKDISPETSIIGCLPAHSPVMAESIKAGHLIEMDTLPTLSDATSGEIEPGSITFEICQKLVGEYVLVSEEEIQQAMILLLKMQHLLVEGASGVALASLIKTAPKYSNKNVVIVLSGANISLETLKKVLL